MIQDSENSNPETNESPELSPVPLTQPQLQPRVGIQQVKDTRDMLVGFRDAIREGTFSGNSARYVAMGLEFIENMVRQSGADLERVKREEKQMEKQAREAIKAAGGKMNEEVAGAGTETASPTA